MKKIITLLLAFALAIPAYVTHLVHTAQQESALEYNSEWKDELLSFETESIEYLVDDFLFFCPVDLALERGLGQSPNEKFVTDDYTISIERIVVDGNWLYTKAHFIPSEKYLIDENVHITLHLELFTSEEEISSRFISFIQEPYFDDVMITAVQEPFFDDIIPIAPPEPMPFREGIDFIDYFETGFIHPDCFELSEQLMMSKIGSSSMRSFIDSTGTVIITNSMYIEDDFELEKIYVTVDWLEIVRSHELEFTLAELADGANDIFDEVVITQDGDKLIIETKILHSQPHYRISQIPHLHSLFVNNEHIWEVTNTWISDAYEHVMIYEYIIPSDTKLDFDEVKLTVFSSEELFSESFSEDSSVFEIQIDQEKILQQSSEEILIDKTVNSISGNVEINSIILNNLTFELLYTYTYTQTYDTDSFVRQHIEVSENVFKPIVDVRLADGSRLFDFGNSGMSGGNSFASWRIYPLVEDVENVVIAILTSDNVYKTIYLSDLIDQ